MSPFSTLPLFLIPALAAAQACSPLPRAPYTQHPYRITHFASYTPSGRPGNTDPATTSFNFTDPNTCVSGYCRASWRPDLGHPGPGRGFFPCNETDVAKGLEFDRGTDGFRVRYTFAGEEEAGTEREFVMVGNGTLRLTELCGGSGTCYSEWEGVASFLADVWEDTGDVAEGVEEMQVQEGRVEKVELPEAESAGRRRIRRAWSWE